MLFSENIFEFDFFSGIKNSEIYKAIYLDNTEIKVSELKWNQDIIPITGVNFSYLFNNLSITTGFSAGIPMTAGSMYDSDWNLAGIKKTYSISKCDTIYDFTTGLGISYNFQPAKIFNFRPIVQIEYHYNNFVAHDGYGWYGGKEHAKIPRDYDVAWDDPLARKAKKIANIDYYRHSVFVFAGFEIGIFPTEKFCIKSSFEMSPFTYMYSMDTHHRVSNPDTHYVEIQSANFSKYKFEIEPSYELNSKNRLYINYSCIFGQEDYGDLYHDYYSEKPTKSNSQPTGANFKSFVLSFGFSLKI